jgi:hypothetical protein
MESTVIELAFYLFGIFTLGAAIGVIIIGVAVAIVYFKNERR